MEKDNNYIMRFFGAILGSRDLRGWYKKTPSVPPPPKRGRLEEVNLEN